MLAKTSATIDDLYREPGKAELINGEIVRMAATGIGPGYVGDAILVSLWAYSKRTKTGHAVGDNKGFRVNLPRRESFSPDVAYVLGAAKSSLKFYDGAPVFAVEVRSEGDYGPAAERQIAQKRADYFAAGTLVVWDVDLLSEEIVRVYRAADPEHPTFYRRGDIAEARCRDGRFW